MCTAYVVQTRVVHLQSKRELERVPSYLPPSFMSESGYPTVAGDDSADDSSSDSEVEAPQSLAPKALPTDRGSEFKPSSAAAGSDSVSDSDSDDSDYTEPCLNKPSFALSSDDSSDDSDVKEEIDELQAGKLAVSDAAVLSEDDNSDAVMSESDDAVRAQKTFKAPMAGTGLNSLASRRVGTGALLGKVLYGKMSEPRGMAEFVVPLLRMLAGRETDEELTEFVCKNCQPMCGPLAHCALGPTLIETVQSLSWEGDPGDDEARAHKQKEFAEALTKRVLAKDKKNSELSEEVVAQLHDFAKMAAGTCVVNDTVVYNGHILKKHLEEEYPTKVWGAWKMHSNDGVLQGDVHACAMEGFAALFATDEYLCRQAAAETTDFGRKKRMIAEQGDGKMISAQETVINMLLEAIRGKQDRVSSPAEVFRQQLSHVLTQEDDGAKSFAGDVCGLFSGFGKENGKLAYGDEILHPETYRRMQARVMNSMRRYVKDLKDSSEESRITGSLLNTWRDINRNLANTYDSKPSAKGVLECSSVDDMSELCVSLVSLGAAWMLIQQTLAITCLNSLHIYCGTDPVYMLCRVAGACKKDGEVPCVTTKENIDSWTFAKQELVGLPTAWRSPSGAKKTKTTLRLPDMGAGDECGDDGLQEGPFHDEDDEPVDAVKTNWHVPPLLFSDNTEAYPKFSSGAVWRGKVLFCDTLPHRCSPWFPMTTLVPGDVDDTASDPITKNLKDYREAFALYLKEACSEQLVPIDPLSPEAFEIEHRFQSVSTEDIQATAVAICHKKAAFEKLTDESLKRIAPVKVNALQALDEAGLWTVPEQSGDYCNLYRLATQKFARDFFKTTSTNVRKAYGAVGATNRGASLMSTVAWWQSKMLERVLNDTKKAYQKVSADASKKNKKRKRGGKSAAVTPSQPILKEFFCTRKKKTNTAAAAQPYLSDEGHCSELLSEHEFATILKDAYLAVGMPSSRYRPLAEEVAKWFLEWMDSLVDSAAKPTSGAKKQQGKSLLIPFDDMNAMLSRCTTGAAAAMSRIVAASEASGVGNTSVDEVCVNRDFTAAFLACHSIERLIVHKVKVPKGSLVPPLSAQASIKQFCLYLSMEYRDLFSGAEALHRVKVLEDAKKSIANQAHSALDKEIADHVEAAKMYDHVRKYFADSGPLCTFKVSTYERDSNCGVIVMAAHNLM